jgi:hypothetical protein
MLNFLAQENPCLRGNDVKGRFKTFYDTINVRCSTVIFYRNLPMKLSTGKVYLYIKLAVFQASGWAES